MTKPAIDPKVWTPPKASPRAKRRISEVALPPVTVVPVTGAGPEDVLVEADGSVITGVEDGRLLRVSADGRTVATIADTGGRPLGIEHLPDGGLLVCDADRGLLRVDAGSEVVEVLVDRVGGVPMRFCDNAAVAGDGTIWFTDSSRRFGIHEWRADIIEHSRTGRLLRRDPDGSVEVVLDGLQFPNGVALAPDESFLVFAETAGYRLSRLALTGAAAGTSEPILENLPAFPDNVSTGTDGLFWVALPSPRNAALDRVLPLPPIVRRVVWALPEALQPNPVMTTWVMAVNGEGRVVHDFQAPDTGLPMITGIREVDGRVYLGSLTASAIGYFDLPVAQETP